jgi:hypothetical protein
MAKSCRRKVSGSLAGDDEFDMAQTKVESIEECRVHKEVLRSCRERAIEQTIRSFPKAVVAAQNLVRLALLAGDGLRVRRRVVARHGEPQHHRLGIVGGEEVAAALWVAMVALQRRLPGERLL